MSPLQLLLLQIQINRDRHNIFQNESKISHWPDFTRFHFCVDPISWDLVLVLTRFHEISFCVDTISRYFVFVLTRFHEIYSRHHRNFDFCYNLAPQYTASLCVLYVCAAEYGGRSHTGTRLPLSDWMPAAVALSAACTERRSCCCWSSDAMLQFI